MSAGFIESESEQVDFHVSQPARAFAPFGHFEFVASRKGSQGFALRISGVHVEVVVWMRGKWLILMLDAVREYFQELAKLGKPLRVGHNYGGRSIERLVVVQDCFSGRVCPMGEK